MLVNDSTDAQHHSGLRSTDRTAIAVIANTLGINMGYDTSQDATAIAHLLSEVDIHHPIPNSQVDLSLPKFSMLNRNLTMLMSELIPVVRMMDIEFATELSNHRLDSVVDVIQLQNTLTVLAFSDIAMPHRIVQLISEVNSALLDIIRNYFVEVNRYRML